MDSGYNTSNNRGTTMRLTTTKLITEPKWGRKDLSVLAWATISTGTIIASIIMEPEATLNTPLTGVAIANSILLFLACSRLKIEWGETREEHKKHTERIKRLNIEKDRDRG